MSAEKHTPGQWIAVGHWVEHVSDKRADICNCDPESMGQDGRSDKEICANARLIAAAPELLAALVRMLPLYRKAIGLLDPNTDIELTVDAHNAIAKATGEPS